MSFSDIFTKDFLSSYSNNEVTFQTVLISFVICIICSLIIYFIYYFKSKKYFYSREFAVSLIALSIITSAVILTIQSSIVVSLGMVGALSIVRFRTAVKNPLDLVFLFWSITVGIICGAGLYYLAIAITVIVGIIILLFDELPDIQRTKILVLSGNNPYKEQELKNVLNTYTSWWNIRTVTVTNDEVTLIIEVKGKKIEELVPELSSLAEWHSVSLMKQEGVVE